MAQDTNLAVEHCRLYSESITGNCNLHVILVHVHLSIKNTMIRKNHFQVLLCGCNIASDDNLACGVLALTTHWASLMRQFVASPPMCSNCKVNTLQCVPHCECTKTVQLTTHTDGSCRVLYSKLHERERHQTHKENELLSAIRG